MKGEANFEVEALSRPTVSAIKYHAAINYKDLSADQALDTEFIRLRHSTSSNIKFRLLKTFDDVLVWCDILTGRSRPYVLRDAPFDFWGGGGLDYYFKLCFFFLKN